MRNLLPGSFYRPLQVTELEFTRYFWLPLSLGSTADPRSLPAVQTYLHPAAHTGFSRPGCRRRRAHGPCTARPAASACSGRGLSPTCAREAEGRRPPAAFPRPRTRPGAQTSAGARVPETPAPVRGTSAPLLPGPAHSPQARTLHSLSRSGPPRPLARRQKGPMRKRGYGCTRAKDAERPTERF